MRPFFNFNLPAARLTPAPGPGTWMLSSAGYKAVPSSALRTLALHPLHRHDPRLPLLRAGGTISLARRNFLLWNPTLRPAPSGRRRLIGRIAVSLVGGDVSGTPTIWLNNEPLAILRNLEHSVYGWVQSWVRGERPMRFTSTGRDLWRLIHVGHNDDGELVVDLLEVR